MAAEPSGVLHSAQAFTRYAGSAPFAALTAGAALPRRR